MEQDFNIRNLWLALGVGAVLLASSAFGIFNPLQDLYEQLSHSIVVPIRSVGRGLEEQFGFLANLQSLGRENDLLRSRISELEGQLVDYEELDVESRWLRRQLDTDLVSYDLNLKHTPVLRYLTATQPARLVIRSVPEIAVGDLVASDNHVVGVVSETHPFTAEVQLLVDPNTAILGVVKDQIVSVSAKPDYSLVVTDVDASVSVEAGFPVRFYDPEGNLPSGLKIGSVGNLTSEETAPSQSFELISPIDMFDLDFLFVIHGY